MATTRTSAAQRGILYRLSLGPVTSIMDLVRYEHSGRGHAASYARVHRLEARGLIAIARQTRGGCNVSITDRGLRSLEGGA